jgi:hypothetical protein
LAGAGGQAVDDNALSVGAAGVGVARVLGFRRGKVGVGLAEEEGIAGVARRAVADGVVVFHVAVGVDAAGARARVLAALADAREVGLAVSLDGALWPAPLRRRRVSDHSGEARANGLLVPDLAVRVSSAW